ncbi:LacI family DNA-binding transcriptional regulator [Bordetella sp. H567]|uniref:LacI family DNA-binding transcriptional regulator n=1 Tax=Bordetella sp. H567 TaxID=1697043 RepID=UPI001F1A962B|nr:LacI family DNA-binding transcriptional regulator [Bordetella sp. H567]
MRPTKKTLTSRDIAKVAGVSQTTVSRVLQGSPLVQPETRKAVLQVIDQLGYQPSQAARSMRTRRTNTVALVVASLSINPLYPALLQLMSAALRRNGLYASVWEAEDSDEDTMRALAATSVDGVIVATAMDAALPLLARIGETRPVVLVNRTVASDAFDQISSDNRAGAAQVAAYFDEHRRHRVGLVTGALGRAHPSPIRDREAGFLAELHRRGIPMNEDVIARVPYFAYQTGFDAARQLLARGDLDAIFCANDIVAIGALDGVRAGGARVPDDTWVVGYDDIPMCAWQAIDLTTVRQPLDAMVEAAVARLCERLGTGNLPPRRVVLPNTLVVRGSSA